MGERGYGLIETMRVREGRIPLWSRHLARLERSLRELDLSTPSQDLVALVTPFAGTGDAVLRLEVRDGGASGTCRAPPPPARSSQAHRARLLRRRGRRGRAGRSGRRPVVHARRVRGGGDGVECVLVGRRHAAHTGTRVRHPSRHRARARARARAARGPGWLYEAAGRREEPVPHECGARRRADRLARRLAYAPRSPHGGARRPVLAAPLSVAAWDQIPPEAPAHYSEANSPRACCTAPRATLFVGAPCKCGTMR